jgi:drug/metabolite transporter (DMT)-like permease
MSKKGLKGLLFVILSSFLWAIAGIMSKALFNEGGTPILLIFTRNVVGVSCLALFFYFYNKKLFHLNRAHLKSLLLCSIFLFLYSAAYFFSIYYLDVSVAMVLLYMYPTIVAVSSVFVFHERLTVKIIAALLLTACGMVLTLNLLSHGIGEVSPLGLLLSFVAAFGAAWYSIYVKKLSVAYHATTINFYGLLFTVFGYGILSLFSLKNGFLSTFELIGAVTMAFPYVGGLLLFAIGVTYLSPSFASIFGSTEPVFGTVMAVIFLGEVISVSQLLGIALVFSAIIILQLPLKRKRLDKEEEEERIKNAPCECPNTIHGV